MTSLFWINRKAAADLVGLSLPTFDVLRARLPAAAIRPGKGNEKLFDARAVVKAFVAREVEQKADPLLLSNGDSPALEEYRRHRAELARLEVEKAHHTHIDVRSIDTTINRFTDRLRACGEVLQRKFGNPASDCFNEGVAAAADLVKRDLEANGNGAK